MPETPAAYNGLTMGGFERQARGMKAAVWLATLTLALALASQVPQWWKLPAAILAFWAWAQSMHRTAEWAWNRDVATPVGWILFCGAAGFALTAAFVMSRTNGILPDDWAAIAVGSGFLAASLPWLLWETASARKRA